MSKKILELDWRYTEMLGVLQVTSYAAGRRRGRSISIREGAHNTVHLNENELQLLFAKLKKEGFRLEPKEESKPGEKTCVNICKACIFVRQLRGIVLHTCHNIESEKHGLLFTDRHKCCPNLV